MNNTPKTLTAAEEQEFLEILKSRFEKNMHRHQGIKWPEVQSRLENQPEKLRSLQAMEATGGEPDVVEYDRQTGEYIFMDCSPETPRGRRSVCYDQEALESRKKYKPEQNAVNMAAEMGVGLLTEEQYLALQKLDDFDTKTSSWLKTPPEVRTRGGALFGDRRFGRVFIYHNGAEAYFGARGWRGWMRV